MCGAAHESCSERQHAPSPPQPSSLFAFRSLKNNVSFLIPALPAATRSHLSEAAFPTAALDAATKYPQHQ
jgi:hypothetical protein